MPDVLTVSQRSFNMSRIRSKDTKPEKKLHDLFIEYELNDFIMHPSSVIGRPDFYFPKENAAIFVDGCFWHGCKECYQEPQTNKDFWKTKIDSNIKRDKVVNKKLHGLGFTVIRIKEHEIKRDPTAVLDSIKEKLLQKMHPTVLDLFAGAGGLSEGFIRSGYEMIGHIEMDKNACDTLITRMIYHSLRKKGKLEEYHRYIRGEISRDELIEKYNLQKERDSVICATINEDNVRRLIKDIKTLLNGKKLDFIVGGPPCQAYSYIGRARDLMKMHTDERNYLYKYYVEFLKALKPKIFVFENVPGLLSAGKGKYLKDMQDLMSKAGYTTDYKVLNAADYGVPQNRKRIILVGWRKNTQLKSYPEFKTVVRKYKVKDFLQDLPKIQAGGGEAISTYEKRNKLLMDLGITDPEFNYLMDHISRPNTQQDLEIYRLVVLAKQNGMNMMYNTLPERLKSHNNENGFLDRFKVVDDNAPGSQTVVAHIAKDGHYYIHPDINQNRSLTVREAARLQTFPDDYKFEGQRGPQFKQIGNAVPPMLSEIIAKELLKYI